jgi:hypothetical protein
VVKVQAIITSRMTPDSRWIANQSLPGVGGDSGVQGQLGTGRVGNYASVAGVQYLAYAYEAIPEPGCGLVVLALAVLMKRARGGTRMGNKRGSGL